MIIKFCRASGCISTIAACFVTLFAWSGVATAAENVVLQLRWDNQFQFAGYYAARWQGYYAEAGLDVEIRSAITPSRRVLRAAEEVAGGTADFGVGAGDIILARDSGAPLVVVANIFQQSPVAIFTRRESKVSSPADLIGMRVARRLNNLVDVEFQSVLKAEGIAVSSVPTVFLHGKQVRPFNLFQSGKVDAYAGYLLTGLWRAKQAGIDISTLRPASYGVDFYGDALFTTQRLTRDRPDLVQNFVAASLKVWRYALEHREEIADRITSELPRRFRIMDLRGFNRFTSEIVAKLTLHPVIELGHTNPDRWRRMHNAIREAGLVKSAFHEEQLIFDSAKDEQQRLRLFFRLALITVAALVVLLVGAIIWIAVRRRFAKVQVESEQRFRRLIEDSNLGIQIGSLEGRRIFANKASATLFGYDSPAELLSRPRLALTAPEDRERVVRYRKALFSGADVPESCVFEGIRKDGSRFPMEVYFRPLQWEGKEAIQRTYIDLSGRKKAEEEVRRLNADLERRVEARTAELQAAIESKTRFLAAASHDMRQPMQAITFLNYALQKKLKDEDVRPLVDQITQNTGVVTSLLDELLDISKLDAGVLDPKIESVALDDVFRKIETGFAIQAKEKGLVFRLVPTRAVVDSDPVLLGRVLQNLVSNALRFTETGKVLVGCRRRREMLRIDVYDTGKGIPENRLDQIFDEFYQVDNAARNRSQGLGLGLAIVRRLTGLLDHRLEVSSRFGKGSRFSVWVPLATVEAHAAAAGEEPTWAGTAASSS